MPQTRKPRARWHPHPRNTAYERSVMSRTSRIASAGVLTIALMIGASFGMDLVGAAQFDTPTAAEIAATMLEQQDVGWILEYLYFTSNVEEQQAKAAFHNHFGLSRADQTALEALARERQVRSRSLKAIGRVTAAQGRELNAEIQQRLARVVGTRFDAIIGYLKSWYRDNQAMRTQQQIQLVNQQKRAAAVERSTVARLFGLRAAASSFSTLLVYQTQFGPSGWDAAVPDAYAKFCTLGWPECPTGWRGYNTASYPAPYSVALQVNGNRVDQAWLKDVGPWNELDNYWDFGPPSQAINPRQCVPYPGSQNDGIPEAQLAVNNGFNGGYTCDLWQGGQQQVLNIAGVDIQPDLAEMLGLCRSYCNGWMYVTFTRLP